MTGVRHWTLTVMDTTDVSSFFILDLHKSEVGPSNIYLFSKIPNFLLFQQVFLPLYTRVKIVRPLKLLFQRCPGFPTSVRHSYNILMSFLFSCK